MKTHFSCFYDSIEDSALKDIWKDPQTIFILDTNVLLSLYSFQPDGRKDFFRVLSALDQRIWIPFHVGLEFQRNRLSVIKKRRSTFNDLNKEIDSLIDTLKFEKKPFSTITNTFSLKKNYKTVQDKLDITLEKVNESFKSLQEDFRSQLQNIKDEVKSLDKDRIFVNSDDFIRKEIDTFFDGKKVGENIFDSQEKLDALYKEGTIRYEKKIPPGYEDEKEKGEDEFLFDGLCYKRKFGDLIIFKQIIDFCSNNEIKNVILISEDVKEDWREVEIFEGTKILGARSELKKEIHKEADVENFFIYKIEEFMSKTNDYLDINIEMNTLDSIKRSLEEDKHKHQRVIEEEEKLGFVNKLNAELEYKKYLQKLKHGIVSIDHDMPSIFNEQVKLREYLNKFNESAITPDSALRAKLEEQMKLKEYLSKFNESAITPDSALRAKLEEQMKFKEYLSKFNESAITPDSALRAKLEEQMKLEEYLNKLNEQAITPGSALRAKFEQFSELGKKYKQGKLKNSDDEED